MSLLLNPAEVQLQPYVVFCERTAETYVTLAKDREHAVALISQVRDVSNPTWSAHEMQYDRAYPVYSNSRFFYQK